MSERINALSIIGNIILAIILVVLGELYATSTDDNRKEVAHYQDRAIAGGLAARDDTGTFYWIKPKAAP